MSFRRFSKVNVCALAIPSASFFLLRLLKSCVKRISRWRRSLQLCRSTRSGRFYASWSTCWCSCRQPRPPPALSDNQWRAWSETRSPQGLPCTVCSCGARSLSCHLQGEERQSQAQKWVFNPRCIHSTRVNTSCERHIPTYKGPLMLSCLIFPGDLPVLAP